MENNKNFYIFFKYLLGIIFLAYYRPKFVNKNYIPKEGPVIICGNHIHLYDQCLPIMSTKRMIHYMAKKEYFDSKFAWFFKKSGCISVDRENHGGNSKNIALDILNNGYALGIYPEGTRNSLVSKKDRLSEIYKYVDNNIKFKNFKKIIAKNKVSVSGIDLLLKLKNDKRISDDEFKTYIYNPNKYLKYLLSKNIITDDEYTNSLLLPIKFGTVSFAKKTNATIVPYAITGKYRFFKNNLKITFAKPFKIDNMSIEAANEKLKYSIIDIIKKNEK